MCNRGILVFAVIIMLITVSSAAVPKVGGINKEFEGGDEQLMELLAKIMTSFKTKDSQCAMTGSPYCSMTRTQLRQIISTLAPVFDVPADNNTYIAVEDCDYLQIDKNSQTVFLKLAADIEIGNIPRPKVIWLNKSPCKTCITTLMNIYEQYNDKPTIYTLHIPVDPDLLSTLEYMQCLAKMISDGFQIKIWEVDNFINLSDVTSDCSQDIKKAQDDYEFSLAKVKAELLILLVNELSNNPNVKDWCREE